MATEKVALHLERARIVRNVQVTGKVLKNNVRVVALMTQAVATDLDCKWLLFEKGAAVRGGFTKVDLEASFENATIVHDIPKMARLRLDGVDCGKFQAFRLGDGKKKPKRVMLTFIMGHTGAPFELIEHIMKIGQAEGTFVVEMPKQKVLPGVDLIQPNEQGLFEGVRPVARYKGGNDKSFTAHFSVAESKEGWHYGYEVKCGKVSDASPVRAANGPLASEQLAIQAATKAIHDVAKKVVNHGHKTHRKPAALLAEWAAAYAFPQMEFEGTAQ